MTILFIAHRTLPSIRHSLLVDDRKWMTTRVRCYYLDLAVPDEILFKLHFFKVFSRFDAELDILKGFKVNNGRRFHPDDACVGCKIDSSNSFCAYATTPAAGNKRDRIGLAFFFEFLKSLQSDAPSLSQGESAMRFLNLAALSGYTQWKGKVVRRCTHPEHYQLLVDRVFTYIYPSVLYGLYKMRSEHPLLVKKFWDLFCITKQTQFMLFQRVPRVEYLQFMLDVANEIKFDFWGMRNGIEGFTELVLLPYVRTNRCHLATMLLDYGFSVDRVVPEEPEETNASWQAALKHASLRFTFKELIPQGYMVWFLARCYPYYENLLELRGFVKLFQKLSWSVPGPPLPPSTVRKNLQKILSQVPSSQGALEEMTTIYQVCDVHFDNSAVPTLSHLCRCAIRERLAANYQLPTAIDRDLYLPTILKRYLRLDC